MSSCKPLTEALNELVIFNPNLYSVTFDGSVFIAVGEKGLISRSSNGENWVNVSDELFLNYVVRTENNLFNSNGLLSLNVNTSDAIRSEPVDLGPYLIRGYASGSDVTFDVTSFLNGDQVNSQSIDLSSTNQRNFAFPVSLSSTDYFYAEVSSFSGSNDTSVRFDLEINTPELLKVSKLNSVSHDSSTNKYFISADSSNIFVSTGDFFSWFPVRLPSEDKFLVNEVFVGPDYYVATAQKGNVFYSTDGFNWQSSNIDSTDSIKGVALGKKLVYTPVFSTSDVIVSSIDIKNPTQIIPPQVAESTDDITFTFSVELQTPELASNDFLKNSVTFTRIFDVYSLRDYYSENSSTYSDYQAIDRFTANKLPIQFTASDTGFYNITYSSIGQEGHPTATVMSINGVDYSPSSQFDDVGESRNVTLKDVYLEESETVEFFGWGEPLIDASDVPFIKSYAFSQFNDSSDVFFTVPASATDNDLAIITLVSPSDVNDISLPVGWSLIESNVSQNPNSAYYYKFLDSPIETTIPLPNYSYGLLLIVDNVPRDNFSLSYSSNYGTSGMPVSSDILTTFNDSLVITIGTITDPLLDDSIFSPLGFLASDLSSTDPQITFGVIDGDYFWAGEDMFDASDVATSIAFGSQVVPYQDLVSPGSFRGSFSGTWDALTLSIPPKWSISNTFSSITDLNVDFKFDYSGLTFSDLSSSFSLSNSTTGQTRETASTHGEGFTAVDIGYYEVEFDVSVDASDIGYVILSINDQDIASSQNRIAPNSTDSRYRFDKIELNKRETLKIHSWAIPKDERFSNGNIVISNLRLRKLEYSSVLGKTSSKKEYPFVLQNLEPSDVIFVDGWSLKPKTFATKDSQDAVITSLSYGYSAEQDVYLAITDKGNVFSADLFPFNWHLSTSFESLPNLSSIIYENNNFLIGGGAGFLAKSADSTNWQTGLFDRQNSIKSLAYDSSSGTYGICGPSSLSLMNQNFTFDSVIVNAHQNADNPGSIDVKPILFMNDIAYGNGIFVAVGNDGIVKVHDTSLPTEENPYYWAHFVGPEIEDTFISQFFQGFYGAIGDIEDALSLVSDEFSSLTESVNSFLDTASCLGFLPFFGSSDILAPLTEAIQGSTEGLSAVVDQGSEVFNTALDQAQGILDSLKSGITLNTGSIIALLPTELIDKIQSMISTLESGLSFVNDGLGFLDSISDGYEGVKDFLSCVGVENIEDIEIIDQLNSADALLEKTKDMVTGFENKISGFQDLLTGSLCIDITR